MIAAAVKQIAKELNQSLRSPKPEIAVVCGPLRPDGAPAAEAADKLLVFLVSIERDAGGARVGRWGSELHGRIAAAPPPLMLNLLVMVAANFGGSLYEDALNLLSHTLAHFQSRPVIDHSRAPDLDAGIERLVMEVEDISLSDLSNLWGVLGGHYMPSVLYRVRMVTFDSPNLTAQLPVVRQPRAGVES